MRLRSAEPAHLRLALEETSGEDSKAKIPNYEDEATDVSTRAALTHESIAAGC